MVLKWTKRTPSVFECSLRQMTKDIVPVTGAGTASTLRVSVIANLCSGLLHCYSCSLKCYMELNWMVVACRVVTRCGILRKS